MKTPIHNGVIRWTSNEKRARERPNLTLKESAMRDLKDWCINKEPELDRREWKLVVHIPESWFLVHCFYCFFVKFFSHLFFFFFDLAFYCLFFFFDLAFLSPFIFSSYFLLLFCPNFLAHVVSSLAYPNLLENKMFGCCFLLFKLYYPWQRNGDGGFRVHTFLYVMTWSGTRYVFRYCLN
jgi:hypothetical protein